MTSYYDQLIFPFGKRKIRMRLPYTKPMFSSDTTRNNKQQQRTYHRCIGHSHPQIALNIILAWQNRPSCLFIHKEQQSRLRQANSAVSHSHPQLGSTRVIIIKTEQTQSRSSVWLKYSILAWHTHPECPSICKEQKAAVRQATEPSTACRLTKKQQIRSFPPQTATRNLRQMDSSIILD